MCAAASVKHESCFTDAAAVHTVLCTILCTILYSRVVHRCSRGCAPVHQVAEVVHTRLCAHNLCAHTTSVLTTPEHPSCYPPVTLLLPSCYPPAVLRVVLRGCAPVHQVAEVVHTRLCASCTQPLCSHNLCAHNPGPLCTLYWQYMHCLVLLLWVFGLYTARTAHNHSL